jgi:hypothetical protein
MNLAPLDWRVGTSALRATRQHGNSTTAEIAALPPFMRKHCGIYRCYRAGD